MITYTGAGSCTITATAAATSIYASATKSVVFSIEQIEQDFIDLKSTVKVAEKYYLSDNGLRKWIKKKFNFSNEDFDKLKNGTIKLKLKIEELI